MRGMDTCRVELLGQPRFFWAGEPYPFSAPPRTLLVLAYILLQGDKVIQRSVAAQDLWGLRSSEGRANLRRHIAYLKGAMPSISDSWIKSTYKTLQWNRNCPFQLDVTEFERLSAAQMYKQAIPLYRGNLMEGYASTWLDEHRLHLRNLQLINLQSAIAKAYESGDHFQAADYAGKVLKIDPWREDALRVALRAMFALGDRVGAVRQYETFVSRLRDEMNLEPLPETRALYNRIAAR